MIIYLGSAPHNENPAQTIDDDYQIKALAECRAWANMLRRHFPDHEKYGIRFTVKRIPHDFGYYFEVVCEFDPTNKEALEYALQIEKNAPGEWDEEAKSELRIHEKIKKEKKHGDNA